ncbi:MAG: hypothetical protein JW913_09655 [Chitinispirillaceae bacterium]|nr:hypothetical protein [Chitinispirillaceae bacterium]
MSYTMADRLSFANLLCTAVLFCLCSPKIAQKLPPATGGNETGLRREITQPQTAGAAHRRTANDDGYEWVSGRRRDALILKRFPDLKVAVVIKERPRNSLDTLQDEEIRQGVKLGLYAWASILPDMNLRFVDSADIADFTVCFEQIRYKSASGVSSLAWNGISPGRITIDIDDIAFRRLDFVSPKMKFERAKAVFDSAAKVWSYYYQHASGKQEYLNFCLNFHNARNAIRDMGKDPENVCINWPCINWDEVPHVRTIGKGREGDHDLAWLVQHEFGHTLGLYHVDMDDITHKKSCAPLSCLPSQRADDRHPVTASTEQFWIPRAGFRQKKLDCITAVSSPSVMIGNVWGVGAEELRGIFDLDADALSTGEADGCNCTGIIDDGSEAHGFRGYNVSYPEIRPGWLIVMRNRTTKEYFFTNDWHAAHDKMGWINNENTRPLDTDWFLVDILDNVEAARVPPAAGK